VRIKAQVMTSRGAMMFEFLGWKEAFHVDRGWLTRANSQREAVTMISSCLIAGLDEARHVPSFAPHIIAN